MHSRFWGVAILGVSFVISSVIFGVFFYQSRMPEKTVRVVGTATKRLDSDVIKWRVSISRNTGVADLKNGLNAMKSDLAVFVQLLKDKGIVAKDLTVQPVNINPVYSQYEKSGSPVGYNILQSVYLISRELDKVESMALNPGFFSEKGITLQFSSLEYYFSKLGNVKRELLAEATLDARKRGESIARSSGNRIARIESARVGVFQITEPYSTEVSDYGVYNTASKEKDITVTVNVTFQLK
jgi:hypothetical protein